MTATILTVQCTACRTTFPVDPAKIPEGGVRARCSVCGGVFPVEREATAAGPVNSASATADRVGAAAFPEPGPDPDSTPEPWSGVATDEPDADGSAVEAESAIAPEASVDEALAEGVDVAAPTGAEPRAADQLFGADAPAPPSTEPTPGAPGFQFGKRDPHDKARRLARVLVSDIITYNADLHERALERGTLKEDFDEEIRKSWAEYVDQVGTPMARETPYWTDALNDLLARGEKVF